MKRTLFYLPFVLFAVFALGNSAAEAVDPDSCMEWFGDIYVSESACIYICGVDPVPSIGLIVGIPDPNDPPKYTVRAGCDTLCDDPDCESPSSLCFDLLFPLLYDGGALGDTAHYWVVAFYNSSLCATDSFCVCITFDSTESGWLPVELTAFTAIAGDREVQLNWTTATESNNDHWDIDRATSENGPWTTIHREPGQGTVSTETNYVYVDRTVQNGETYWYRLTDVSIAGERETHQVVSATPEDQMEQVPGEFALKQNFPNPFNPTTTFEFAIAEPGFTTLKIYNLLGREVASVVEEYLEARLYHLTWGAGNLPSGVYLYTLTNGNFSDTRKLLLMK